MSAEGGGPCAEGVGTALLAPGCRFRRLFVTSSWSLTSIVEALGSLPRAFCFAGRLPNSGSLDVTVRTDTVGVGLLQVFYLLCFCFCVIIFV